MGDFIEEKVDEHPILWCELNKTVVVSTLEAKPEELIEGKASQDGVLNATTTLSTHSKDNALVSSEGLRYVPPPLRQATKRGRNSPWMRDKKEKKDKGKLDELGKQKTVKASGVKTNVSHMEWNHSTNLWDLKGQPLKFHDDHSHNKGIDAYLPSSTFFFLNSIATHTIATIVPNPPPITIIINLRTPSPPASIIADHRTHHRSPSSPSSIHHHRTSTNIKHRSQICHRPPSTEPTQPPSTTFGQTTPSSTTITVHHHHHFQPPKTTAATTRTTIKDSSPSQHHHSSITITVHHHHHFRPPKTTAATTRTTIKDSSPSQHHHSETTITEPQSS
ncbi:hypothetical protein PIB30_103278 [Stylosanthes scabra]|uniref:Uncharacterized protein n=1 Tax=Stylosanthes scabra TaxID=79078 RepID=A0ABU6YYL1_9FABA|nr:hypothetical protein [Stylosanthes scabra]